MSTLKKRYEGQEDNIRNQIIASGGNWIKVGLSMPDRPDLIAFKRYVEEYLFKGEPLPELGIFAIRDLEYVLDLVLGRYEERDKKKDVVIQELTNELNDYKTKWEGLESRAKINIIRYLPQSTDS